MVAFLWCIGRSWIPVRFPILWGLDRRWLHWDGNTNSVMERNVGQAMGLGAVADAKQFHSTLRPADLHRLEELARGLKPPAWPGAFGRVDKGEYRQGKDLYDANCASCHERQEPGKLGWAPD